MVYKLGAPQVAMARHHGNSRDGRQAPSSAVIFQARWARDTAARGGHDTGVRYSDAFSRLTARDDGFRVKLLRL